jgi:hypothetical protein
MARLDAILIRAVSHGKAAPMPPIIHAGRTSIGAGQPIGVAKNVFPANLVVEQVGSVFASQYSLL